MKQVHTKPEKDISQFKKRDVESTWWIRRFKESKYVLGIVISSVFIDHGNSLWIIVRKESYVTTT